MRKQLFPLLAIAVASTGCGRTSAGSSTTSVLPTVAAVTTTVPATANPTESSGPTTTAGSDFDAAETTTPYSELPPPDTMTHPTNITPPPPGEDEDQGGDLEPQFNPDELVEPGVVRLSVSNQSFADPTVHLTAKIDGDVVADADFAVEGQHNWINFDSPPLTPGEHELTVESDTGASITQVFTLPDGEARYIGVDYWYYPDEGEDRHITIEESATPLQFA